MALDVETGTGSATAESYATVAQADAYLAARGYTSWASLTEAVKEQSLRIGTAHMLSYGWKGQRIVATQALDWPRVGVLANQFYVDSDIVPVPVRNACIELAYRASAAELVPDLTQKVSSETVGPISVTYEAGSQQAKRFRAVDIMLAAYVAGGGGTGMVKISRA